MTGADLRAARERLGFDLETVAAEANVAPARLETWEKSAFVTLRHELLVRWAIWQLEADAALARSGLPECETLEDMHRHLARLDNPKEELQTHRRTCDVCRAREKYIAEHVSPAPPGPPIVALPFMARILVAVAGGAPSFLRPAMMGALMVGLMVAIPVVLLLVTGLLSGDRERLMGAGLLVVVALGGGGFGGLVYGLLKPVRRIGWAGGYLQAIGGVYGYLLATLGLLRVVASPENSGDIGETLEFAATPAGIAVFLMVGAVFGIVVGRQIQKPDAPASADEEEPSRWRRWRPALLLVIVALAVIMRNRGSAPVDPARDRIDSLSAEVQQWPDSAQLHAALAFALLRSDHRDSAGPHLHDAARLAPDDSTIQGFAARGFAELAQWEDAFAIADRWVARQPESVSWWAIRGASAFFSNRMDVARASYRRVNDIDSTYVSRFTRHAEVVAELTAGQQPAGR